MHLAYHGCHGLHASRECLLVVTHNEMSRERRLGGEGLWDPLEIGNKPQEVVFYTPWGKTRGFDLEKREKRSTVNIPASFYFSENVMIWGVVVAVGLVLFGFVYS